MSGIRVFAPGASTALVPYQDFGASPLSQAPTAEIETKKSPTAKAPRNPTRRRQRMVSKVLASVSAA